MCAPATMAEVDWLPSEITWKRAPPSCARRSKSGGITMARLARPPSIHSTSSASLAA
jgi:hypothetical protein